VIRNTDPGITPITGALHHITKSLPSL
jgi:hypothetical protein